MEMEQEVAASMHVLVKLNICYRDDRNKDTLLLRLLLYSVSLLYF